ncbi:MAG: threonine synthase [Candidatus Desulforudis sp.]|nr:threonine synthase [Desulforudis sp.]
MLYESTRGRSRPVSASEAIKLGIAPDGGLFVPERVVVSAPDEIERMSQLDYRQRAALVLSRFLTDFDQAELIQSVNGAYNQDKFTVPEIAPVRSVSGDMHFLELWHGPTCAFKDMALQILPHLLMRAVAKTGETAEIVILVATSGDTGKAALEGFRDVSGTRIIVFFPAEGVSEMQRLQMVTQEGGNVHVIAVRGNFDDTQSGVKAIFADPSVNAALHRHGRRFSSANSINWGRLVPQVAYYFSAYLDLRERGALGPGQAVNFVVPTGNFGNILAAFYARRMGLPVNRLICAANRNNVLTDFIRTGTYDRNRTFYRTVSPSMDILISSNLERLLFEMTGRDAARVDAWMSALRENGRYQVDPATREQVSRLFWSDFADEEETMDEIRSTWQDHRYLIDPHTAVGKAVLDKYKAATGDNTPAVVVSTASPFKFNQAVARVLLGAPETKNKTEFELLEALAAGTGLEIPPGLRGLDGKPVRHRMVVDKEQMQQAVLDILS